MPQQILLRRGTSAAWELANPILASGEPGVESNTGKFKIGNGTSLWNDLDYAVGEIPTLTSDLTNDSGFITQGDIPSIPSDISDLNDSTGLIPVNLEDLSNVDVSTLGLDTILRWSGTAWTPDNESVRFDTVILPGPTTITSRDDAKTLFFGSIGGNIEFVGDPITNTVNIDVKTGPEFGGPVSAGGGAKQGTFYGATLQNDTADITIQPGAGLTPNGRLNIGSVVSGKDGNLLISRNTYSTVYGQGFWFNQHHETADVVNFNFLRSRGTGQTPTAVQSGDDVADVLFWARGTAANQVVAGLQVGVTGSPSDGRIPAKIEFLTDNGTNYAIRCEISDKVKTDSISAYTANTDLTLSGSGTGVVRLPIGTTVGGAPIGSIIVKGSVATSSGLPSTGQTLGDAYIAIDTGNMWTYTGSSDVGSVNGFVDTGPIRGPAGVDGNDGADGDDGVGVPVGGSTGQVLAKSSSTNYATSWITPFSGAYADLSGSPTLATIATSGAYADLSGAPTSITDFGITDGTSGQVLTTDGSGNFTFTTVSSSAVAALDDLTDVVITAPATSGQVLKYNGTNWVNGTDDSSTIFTRQELSGSTGTLANGARGPINITGYKSYALLKIQTSAAAWVRIYVSEAARAADESRTEGEDPLPGAGIIAEVITTGAETVLITPGTIGFNNETIVTTNIPCRVTNKSGGDANITVTLTAIQLEA